MNELFRWGRSARLSGRFFLALLIVLALVKGTIYSVLVPPWQAPDEPKYLEYIWLLHEKGRLFSPGEASPSMQQEIIRSMAQYDYWALSGRPQPTPLPTSFEGVWGFSNSVLGSPPLAFLFSLPGFSLVANEGIITQLYVMRLTTVLLGAAVIAIAYLVAREVFPGDTATTRAVPALLLFMPMFSFIAGSYTNELMADFASALWLYAMVRILRKGFSPLRGMALLATLVMAYLSKRSGLFLIPLSVIFVPFLVSRGRGLGRAAAISLLGTGVMALLVLIVASLPEGGLRYALLDRYFWGPLGDFLGAFKEHDYFSYAYLDLLVKYFQTLFESFWGVFGWMNIRLDNVWYYGIGALCSAATVGVVLALLTRSEERNPLAASQQSAILLCVVAILFAIAPAIAQYSAEFTPRALPQGRYLFPVVIPVSILMVVGLRRVMPSALARVAPLLLVAFMFLFDTASLALYIYPFYYG